MCQQELNELYEKRLHEQRKYEVESEHIYKEKQALERGEETSNYISREIQLLFQHWNQSGDSQFLHQIEICEQEVNIDRRKIEEISQEKEEAIKKKRKYLEEEYDQKSYEFQKELYRLEEQK